MNDETDVLIHDGCGGLVELKGEDGISYCTECEYLCEGETKFISEEEFENR